MEDFSVIPVMEAAIVIPFTGECLYHAHAIEILCQSRIHRRNFFSHTGINFAGAATPFEGKHKQNRHENEDYTGHWHVYGEHDDQDSAYDHHVTGDGNDGKRDKFADHLHIAHNARDQPSDFVAGEKADVKRLDVIVQHLAHITNNCLAEPYHRLNLELGTGLADQG